MSIFPEAMRNRLRSTFTNQAEGSPDWVIALEQGDDAGFFAPGSATWAVHGQTPTIVAGVRALLMQALHPGAMAGVHDWSRYKEDPLGRLAGTIRWIYTVSYGDTATAIAASNWVLRLHGKVQGTYLDAAGREKHYAANDPELLSWVHLAFTDSFLATAKLWGGPIPGGPDAYVREWAKAGELMGVPHPPRSEAELAAQLRAFYDAGVLKSDERVAEALSFIRRPPLAPSMMPGYAVLFAGAVRSIPPVYREMLGLKTARLGPVPLPTVPATGLVLKVIGNMLGHEEPSATQARKRLVRLEREAAGPRPARILLRPAPLRAAGMPQMLVAALMPHAAPVLNAALLPHAALLPPCASPLRRPTLLPFATMLQPFATPLPRSALSQTSPRKLLARGIQLILSHQRQTPPPDISVGKGRWSNRRRRADVPRYSARFGSAPPIRRPLRGRGSPPRAAVIRRAAASWALVLTGGRSAVGRIGGAGPMCLAIRRGSPQRRRFVKCCVVGVRRRGPL